MNDFIKAMTQQPTEPEIIVTFKSSPEPVSYTAAIMQLLKTDPEVETITDAATGKVLFSR